MINEEIVISIIREMKLGIESNIINDIPLNQQGMDSLDLMNFYLRLEEKFSVKITDDIVESNFSIIQLVDYIKSKL